LLRLRNLMLVVAPAVAVGVTALLIATYLGGAAGDGALAVALVPAPLFASEVVTRLRGRMDLAGVFVLGTGVLSLLVIGSRGAVAAGGLFAAMEAYAVAAMIGNGLPTVRDVLLVPLRIGGWLVAAAGVAVAIASGPVIDAGTAIAAGAVFVSGALSAGIVATALRRDVIASVGGSGLRDPVLAIALASLTTGPQSTGVAIVYGVCCLTLAALALRVR